MSSSRTTFMLEDGIEHDSLVPQFDLENPSKRLQYWFSNQGDPLAPFRKTKKPVSASTRKRRRKLWRVLALSVIVLLLIDILLHVLTEDTSNFPIKDDDSASAPLLKDFPNQSALFLGDSMMESAFNASRFGWGLQLTNTHQFSFDVLIRAKNGYTTHVWQERGEAVIESLLVEPSLIFIMVGSDEVQQNPDARGYADRLISLIHEFRNNLSEFQMIFMTPFPLVTEDPAPYWIYRHEVISLGERFNIPVFDSWAALMADGEGPVNVDVYQKDEVSSLVDPSGWTQKGNEKLWPKLKAFLERTVPVDSTPL